MARGSSTSSRWKVARTSATSSTNRQSAFASRICSIVRQWTSSSRGLATRYGEALRARDRDVEAVAREAGTRGCAARPRRSRSPSRRRRPAPPVPGTCRRCRSARRGPSRARRQRTWALYGVDDQDVVPAESTLAPARSVNVPPISRPSSAAIAVGLLGRRAAVALVLDREEAEPRPARPGESIRWRAHVGHRVQPPLVERLRDEAADVRVHAPGASREEPAVGRDRRRRRRAGARAPRRRAPSGWIPCEHLARAAAGRRAGRRSRAQVPIASASASETWPGLVDEEVVDAPVQVLAREEPGRAGERAARRGTRGSVKFVWLLEVVTNGPRRRRPSSARGTRRPRSRAAARPRRAGCGSPCGSSR